MFSWLKGQRNAGTTVAGQQPDTLIRTAAWGAAEVISDQFKKYQSETRRDCTDNSAVRIAIDDFIVGYAVGHALNFIQINGGNPKMSPSLSAQLQSRLETFLPKIDASKAVKGNNSRFKCGIFLGSVEGSRTGRNETIEHALQLTHHYQLTPKAVFQMTVDKSLRLSAEEYDLVGEAGQLIAMHSGNPNAS